MATQLSIVNKVLRRLREDEVSSVASTAYSQLIADFLNDIIEDMQTDYDWSQLETDISVSVLVSTTTYDLSSDTNNRSVVRFDEYNGPLVFVYDDGSDTEGAQLNMLNTNEMYRRIRVDEAQTGEDPIFFSLKAQPDVDGLEMEIYPSPNNTRTIKARFWVPMTELETDGSNDSTVLYLPSLPLFRGVLFLALNERGEELGEPGGIAERRYDAAKGEAIHTDMVNRQRTNEYEGRRD